MGTIKESNTRIAVTIDKKFKAELEKLAEKEGRSLSNLALMAIKEYYNNHK
ncbi:ribbon-helix-helix domain-containing protein [Clostridium culturomicium]|uniref:ribbon-helix-helix domain-containing protein n=1 Tax=Clostridium culturomicium TaxID=1499683 RepID=UPI0009DDB91D|nr:ribbon-helix-helix protein, CopG family [Clostridium culturomicium]